MIITARWNDTITLVAITPPPEGKTDSGGFILPGEETSRDIFGNKISAGFDEYNSFTLAGVQVEFKFDVFTVDFNGEDIAVYNGKRYRIVRAREAKNGEITELTLALYSKG